MKFLNKKVVGAIVVAVAGVSASFGFDIIPAEYQESVVNTIMLLLTLFG